MLKPVPYVWCLNSFLTAAIVKDQRKLSEFRMKNVGKFHSETFALGDVEQTQNKSIFLAIHQQTVAVCVKAKKCN
jgi:hypothetical protein